ncbi:MAG: GNAT family N-acetyltransferase [Actinomycetota bacterium]
MSYSPDQEARRRDWEIASGWVEIPDRHFPSQLWHILHAIEEGRHGETFDHVSVVVRDGIEGALLQPYMAQNAATSSLTEWCVRHPEYAFEYLGQGWWANNASAFVLTHGSGMMAYSHRTQDGFLYDATLDLDDAIQRGVRAFEDAVREHLSLDEAKVDGVHTAANPSTIIIFEGGDPVAAGQVFDASNAWVRVDPAHRRKGYGRQVLKWLVEHGADLASQTYSSDGLALVRSLQR